MSHGLNSSGIPERFGFLSNTLHYGEIVFLPFFRNEGKEARFRTLDIGLAEVTRICQKVFSLAKKYPPEYGNGSTAIATSGNPPTPNAWI
jgi:hypothetical protein